MIPVTDTANVKLRILAHSTDNDEKSKIMELKKIHIHPEYIEDFKRGYQDYDVALLELKESLDFWNPNGPLPVCILSSEDNLDLVGRMGTVIGWGMTAVDDPTSGASALQQINVPIQPLEKCKVLSALEVTDRFICAGTFDPGHDTLHGDSGGPLMVETLHNRMLQIGVVSWGDLERRKTEGLFSDVAAAMYTNVSKPEILSYIDYFSKKADARWCKKSFFGPNPRRPWEGRQNVQKIINPDCVCGMPDQTEPDENNPTSEFPWTVLVIKLDRPGTISYCMGTIINTLFVLTSAHCLRSSEKVQIHLRPTIHYKKVRIQTIDFETEAVDLNSTTKIIKAAAIHIHPDFLSLEGENRFERNIGLIRLEKPLTFTNRRKRAPVCLPSEWETSDFVGTEAMVTGWNRTSIGKRKKVTLQVLDEKILPTDSCGKLQRLGVNKNYICTESKKPSVPVKMTEGGSVTVDTKKSQLIQIGVMSHFGLITSKSKRRYANVKDSLPFIEYFSQEAKATWCQRVSQSTGKK